MNKPTLAIQTIFSIGIGVVVNFFILRTVMRKLNRPQEEEQRTRLAILVSVLLTIPSIVRTRQLIELEEAQPAEV